MASQSDYDLIERATTKSSPPETETFDVVVIGSSPISLCKALQCAENGQKVCLIERADRLGGAWATEDCMGLQNVETSPHIFMPDTIANGILINMFPGIFAEIQRDAKEVFFSKKLGKVAIPLRNCVSVSVIRNFVRWIEGGDHSALVKIVLFLAWSFYSAQKRWRNNRCKLIYPVNGLDEWFADIRTRLNALGATVKLLQTVSVLEITKDPKHPAKYPVKISLSDGTRLLADKVCITTALNVRMFKINGNTVPVNYEGRHTQHMTMLIEGESLGEFWNLYGDDKFEMVNDVTDYVRTKREGLGSKRVITTRLNRRHLYLESDFDHYAARLAEVGYLKNDFTVLDHVVRDLQEQRMCSATKSRITQLSNQSCIILEAGEKGLEAAIRRYFGTSLDNVGASELSLRIG